MCGIALILLGVRFIRSHLHGEEPSEPSASPLGAADEVLKPILSVCDLEAALRRRGPDNLSSRKLFLHLNEKDDARGCIVSGLEDAIGQDCVGAVGRESVAELLFVGATLQLRGLTPVFQPLVDGSRNILAYNGEIFGGINVGDASNDAEALLHALERCCSCDCLGLEKACSCEGEKQVPEILSTIRGPWALVYWQEKSKTVWFGRDAIGRRSLLVHWPTFDDSRFILSSVSPSSVMRDSGSTSGVNGFEHVEDSEVGDMACEHSYWEELPCGIYSIHLDISNANEKGQYLKEILFGKVKKYEWTDPLLSILIKCERTFLDPKVEEISLQRDALTKASNFPGETRKNIGGMGDHLINPIEFKLETIGLRSNIRQSGHMQPAQKLLVALRESVMRRTTLNSLCQAYLDENIEKELVPIAILFSGGLDSMILAALLDQCLSSRYTIDLLNVSFDGQLAPDRVSARVGLKELQRIAPTRRWQLVEIDASLSGLTWEIKHLMSLIHPAKTYMDLNIGIAIWLAAGGDGWIDGEICNDLPEEYQRFRYKSSARVLLVGSGADEQCAGYGRHRTKYRKGGWVALQEEMRLDMQRIWKRNLGRDDRCISDHGKEARFPFLDEDVIRTLLEMPLWEIAELDEPMGIGDKKILREVARLLGLDGAAVLPKRAIQFGSRIARESNRKNFGSNRAANLASAGSVEIR